MSAPASSSKKVANSNGRSKNASRTRSKAKTPRQPQSLNRSQLQRMLTIHQMLKADRYPNCSTLIDSLGTLKDRKAVLRLIQTMQDDYGLPIEFSREKNGYYYCKPVDHFPLLLVSEDELMTLCIARLALEPFRGSCLEDVFDQCFRKLFEQGGPMMSETWEQVSGAISFRATGAERMPDVKVLGELIRAIIEREELEFQYAKPDLRKKEKRKVRPLHVRCVDHTRYLVTDDVDRNRRRRFKLIRMEELRGTGRHFAISVPFDPKTEFANSLGVYGGEKPVEVRIRFHNSSAVRVRETEWHVSQKFFPENQDDVTEWTELTMQVVNSPELERWVLRWGGDAEVLGPPELREAIVRHAQALIARTVGSATER